jgi:hypothetical protein
MGSRPRCVIDLNRLSEDYTAATKPGKSTKCGVGEVYLAKILRFCRDRGPVRDRPRGAPDALDILASIEGARAPP